MDRKQTAVDTFNSNFNCAQAVFSAFAPDLGLERPTALKIASCFGGGMRCGEVCGAVTGALMALGLKYGQSLSEDTEAKLQANAKASAFIELFKKKHGTILCKDLLGYNLSIPDDLQKIKEQNLFGTVCPRLVADATELAEQIL